MVRDGRRNPPLAVINQEVRRHVNDMEGVHGFDFLHGSWNVVNVG